MELVLRAWMVDGVTGPHGRSVVVPVEAESHPLFANVTALGQRSEGNIVWERGSGSSPATLMSARLDPRTFGRFSAQTLTVFLFGENSTPGNRIEGVG